MVRHRTQRKCSSICLKQNDRLLSPFSDRFSNNWSSLHTTQMISSIGGTYTVKITVCEKEEVVIFRLKGRVISPSIKQVLKTVEETLIGHAASPRFVFDFREVTQIDGAGLGMLMKIHTEMLPCGGKIAVINMNKHIRNVIVRTRLIAVLKCFKNEDDAVAGLLQHF